MSLVGRHDTFKFLHSSNACAVITRPERWDEWIAWDSPRICPFRSRTAHSALSSAPSSHTNHLSPQPNTHVLHAPVTGVNDIRTLLPEVASLFRLLLPIVEEAAMLAEEVSPLQYIHNLLAHTHNE